MTVLILERVYQKYLPVLIYSNKSSLIKFILHTKYMHIFVYILYEHTCRIIRTTAL